MKFRSTLRSLSFMLVTFLLTLQTSVVVAQSLPDGWIGTDIGNPSVAGSTSFDASQSEFVVTGAGRDIWGRSDQFHFLHQPAQGDFSIETGNINSILPLTTPHPWTKAGAMIRQDLSPDSPYVYLTNTGNRGLRIQYRAVSGGRSVDFTIKHGVELGSNQLFLMIERRGDVFRFLISSNQGGFFDPRGVFLIGSLTLPMTDSVFAGTAVTSHKSSTPVTARIQQFRTSITSLATPTFPPTPNNQPPINSEPGAPTPLFFDLEPKLLFPLETFSNTDGPERLFIKDVVTFPDRYGQSTGSLTIVGDAVVYTPSATTTFLAPWIFSESFEVVVSDGINDVSVFYYPYFCEDAAVCG